ncbi:23S rRNA (uracil(1939)-C(5))-methyltransferase RlmD [Simiduia sp. 21SJ11W-1]|uniref:23S rRNA (uracil(1939)-C(5))-methyltransferase RlmD n=1 Tax=Simiduia sp. 21SJ11W-1 TaxID=2909669 RepID=UPI0020A17C2B|nr:23S rRNA (uracil(1939)-C(5))-methyltransferase RlmD [Simiduia sp. 21SJ11W-1]UTA46279.1 23S rRNA (uracil(1939)-C(5))-methyltransferase RlmD [Simiduia sp. 21SJ11W-1]
MAARPKHNRRPARTKAPEVRLPRNESEVTIERLAHDGRGIGYVDGKVTFVEQALAGESHRVRVIGGKSKFYEAVSSELLSAPAQERAVPSCPHYQSCGGCHLQHMSLDAQIAFKQDLVADQCRRNGVSLPGFSSPLAGAGLGYRGRCRLSVHHKGEAFAGFRQKGQAQLVKIKQCDVLVPSLAKLIEPLQGALSQITARSLGHVELIDDSAGPVIIVRHVADLSEQELAVLQQLADTQSVRLLLQPNAEPALYLVSGEAVSTQFSLSVPGLNAPLAYRAEDFTQVNRQINQQMVAQALNWLPLSRDQTWIDLYCGVGNFSLPLATRVGSVHGVEGVADMVAQAELNARNQGLDNCSFYAADLEQAGIYRRLPKQVDGVLLDPPRAGAKTVVGHIASLKPAHILYVSCDPATFARDAAMLTEQGYKIDKIGIIDMFPQTMHVETMAVFRR